MAERMAEDMTGWPQRRYLAMGCRRHTSLWPAQDLGLLWVCFGPALVHTDQHLPQKGSWEMTVLECHLISSLPCALPVSSPILHVQARPSWAIDMSTYLHLDTTIRSTKQRPLYIYALITT